MRQENPADRIRRLVEAYQTPLLRMCYMQLGDRQLAEDVVQETFCKAYQGLGRFRGECSEKTWLMKIALNTCRDAQRSAWFRHVNRKISLEMLPEEGVEEKEEETALTQAIWKLPAKLRFVVLLYYYQGMSVREIAQAEGISQPAVSGRLSRARVQLAKTLKGGHFDE